MRLAVTISGLATAIIVAATSCNALPPLASGCGNKVIDDGEDCDGNYDSSSAKCIAPGQPSACHFSCLDSACPATFTCGGIDHVCRRSAGTFTTSASIAGEPARRVLVGDFDGDSAEDVVTVGLTSRVHFFDGHTSKQQTLLSSEASLPALGHVTTDGRTSGLVTSTYTLNAGTANAVPQGNVRVWRGSADRTLLPTVYPNIDLTAQNVTNGHAISVLRANTVGSDVFALFTIKGTSALFYVNGTQASTQPFPVSGALPDPTKIRGRVPVGTLGDATCTSPNAFDYCQAIVLAFVGDTSVSVHSSCDDTFLAVNALGANYVPPQTFTLPKGDTVAGSAFLFGTSSTSAPSLYVTGTKGVYEFPPDATSCSLSTTAKGGDRLPIATTEPPLALGYIADLTHLAWVDTKGVHVDTPNGAITTQPPASTVWKDAIIGDMNLNGLPDVVAVATSSLDFYNGTGSVLLNGKHITLDGTATHMTIGDFDGDFVSDIAVSTTGDSTGLATDSINIAFGTFTGFPINPVSVGRLANLAQLEPTFFDYRIAGSPDLINTLFAMGTGTGTNDLVVSILQGNPDRLINSPYFLFDQGAPESSLVATAVGDFSGTSHQSIAGISVSPPSTAGLWFTPMTGDAQVDVSGAIFGALPSGVSINPLTVDRAGVAAIDVGGGNEKELLVVQSGAFFLTRVPKKNGDPWPSLSFETLQNVDGLTDNGIVVRVADVDGDGDDDVIVEYLVGTTFTVKIILNGMNGALSFNGASALSLPEGTVAVTTIHASKDGATQIAALSPKGVYLAQMTNGVLGAWSADPIIALQAGAVHDMIAGDVDGDGVEDVVIATATGFIVYFGDQA